MSNKRGSFIFPILILLTAQIGFGQTTERTVSIGGAEHDSKIYGVTIGMDVPTALEAVFLNAGRQPGQEKPDALKKEGKDQRDIRVVYKGLPNGELQIVFSAGKFVKEILLIYSQPPIADDLRLPFSSSIGSVNDTANRSSARGDGVQAPAVLDGSASIEEFGSSRSVGNDPLSAARVGNISRSQSDLLDGTRYDDRYTIGFTDNLKLQKIWWRDEKTVGEYSIRVAFIGNKLTAAGGKFVASIIQKTIAVKPGDESKFESAVNNH